MSSNFALEMTSWTHVISAKKGIFFFLSLAITLMIALFLLAVFEYRLLGAQIEGLSSQVEVIAELTRTIPTPELEAFQKQLEKLPEVSKIEYWSREQSAQFIDRSIFPGYLDFLKKAELDPPVAPLFRLQVKDLREKRTLEERLKNDYAEHLSVISFDDLPEEEVSGFQFITSISHAMKIFQAIIFLALFCLFGLNAFLTTFLMLERSRGFHPTQWLHVSPPYFFFPAFFVSTIFSAIISFFGMLITSLIIGSFLFLFFLSIFGFFVLMNLIIVFAARYRKA